MAPTTAQPLLLAVFVIVFSLVSAQDPICYGQQGVENDKMFSCQPTAAESACCAPGDICYSSGLCAPGPTENQDTVTPFFWNGCTDPSFTSSACFSSCFNLPGNGVQVCPNVGPNHYCCYQFGGCNCSDPSQVFSIAAATIITTINPSITHTSQSSTATTSSSTTTTGSSSNSASTTNPASSSPTSSSPSATSTLSNAQKSTNEVPVAVPIGVGVGLGVPLILLVAGLLFYLLRRPGAAAPDTMLLANQKPSQATDIGGYYNTHEMAGQSGQQYSAGAYAPGELPAGNR
ncbi:hypothetical protein OIDMADRAFT_175182 [Oidiodendron maius Zn]|uniref:Mid2 domain-containing protein n=1 Tax=Oidiodendron maius (strain Zn) TaxID=913774 RepID=A0A0C3HJG5_OIDMZ|nr:hypothetical protein OIDMADRAFT_175182 [Oidiodendron maius Zn]